MKTKAFTLIELFITMAVLVVVSVGFFSALRYYKASAIASTAKTINLNAMRSALDKFKHDLLIAKGVYNNDYSTVDAVSSAFSTLTTGTNHLIIKLPSINSAGEFIDVNDTEYTDYCYYYISNGQLIRKTFKSAKTGSSRSTEDYVFSKGLNSISFSDGLHTLGTLDNLELLSLRHLQITLTALVSDTAFGATHTETLILNVSFRNYQ